MSEMELADFEPSLTSPKLDSAENSGWCDYITLNKDTITECCKFLCFQVAWGGNLGLCYLLYYDINYWSPNAITSEMLVVETIIAFSVDTLVTVCLTFASTFYIGVANAGMTTCVWRIICSIGVYYAHANNGRFLVLICGLSAAAETGSVM
eukprot:UN28699